MTARLTLSLAALTLLGLLPQAALAQSKPRVVILGEAFDGDVPDKLQKAMRASLQEVLKKDRRGLAVMDQKATQDTLQDKNPALVGCVTERCLQRVGVTLQASAALKTAVSGEAQIYNYEIWIYDLTTGQIALNEKATCEVCTNEEATSLYARALGDALQRVPLQPPPAPEPPPEPPKVVEAPKVVDPPKEKPPKAQPSAPKVSLKVKASPPGALIELGDLPLGAGDASVDVAPGTYRVRVSADGHQPRELQLEITPDQGPVLVYADLAPAASPANQSGDEAPPAPSPTPRAGNLGLTIAGWSLIAVGAIGTGAGAWLLGLDGDTTCAEGEVYQCPRVFNTTTEGSLLLGGGAILLTSGVFMAILGADDDEPAPSGAAQLHLGLDPRRQEAFVGFSTPF